MAGFVECATWRHKLLTCVCTSDKHREATDSLFCILNVVDVMKQNYKHYIYSFSIQPAEINSFLKKKLIYALYLYWPTSFSKSEIYCVCAHVQTNMFS